MSWKMGADNTSRGTSSGRTRVLGLCGGSGGATKWSHDRHSHGEILGLIIDGSFSPLCPTPRVPSSTPRQHRSLYGIYAYRNQSTNSSHFISLVLIASNLHFLSAALLAAMARPQGPFPSFLDELTQNNAMFSRNLEDSFRPRKQSAREADEQSPQTQPDRDDRGDQAGAGSSGPRTRRKDAQQAAQRRNKYIPRAW